jgi:small-conductance mechanosensitive channel
MENLIAGIILKIEDKYREGEEVAVNKESGIIEEITYLDTKIRKTDNSIISLPNHKFLAGEVLNWSRTPYRNFETSVNVPLSSLNSLPTFVNDLKVALKAMPGVESSQREIVVSASGFESSSIIVDISMHFESSSSTEAAEYRTNATKLILDLLRPLL